MGFGLIAAAAAIGAAELALMLFHFDEHTQSEHSVQLDDEFKVKEPSVIIGSVAIRYLYTVQVFRMPIICSTHVALYLAQ